MSQSKVSKSPLNIRRINFPIAEGILRTLDRYEDGLKESLLVSEGLTKAYELDVSIIERTTKCNETIMELRRLGLIERTRIGNSNVYNLLDNGRNSLLKIDEIGRELYFYYLLYEMEPLFKQFVDMLHRKGKMDAKEALAISGMNPVKINFIRSILKQVPSIARFSLEGRKSIIEYVGAEPVSESDIRKFIVQNYLRLRGNRLFVTIDELWQSILQKHQNISEELFDKVLLDLVSDHLGRVELQQGVSPQQAKLLLDIRSGTYFHYLKIPEDVLEIEGRGDQYA